MRDDGTADDTWGTFGFIIKLQLRHPRRSTDALCKALGLRPRWARVAGQPHRTGGTLAYSVTVHGEPAMGFSFGPELLQEIGRLGIEPGVEALRVRQRSR